MKIKITGDEDPIPCSALGMRLNTPYRAANASDKRIFFRDGSMVCSIGESGSALIHNVADLPHAFIPATLPLTITISQEEK